MLVGLLAAIAHGAVLPLSMLVFGQMINFFVFQSISASITASNTANNTANQTNIILNAVPVNCSLVDQTVQIARASDMSSEQMGTLGNADFYCITSDGLFNQLNIIVAEFVALAVGSMLLGFIQVSTFSLAAMRQTHHIRKRFYRSILRQNVAWFDENKAGELNSRLVE